MFADRWEAPDDQSCHRRLDQRCANEAQENGYASARSTNPRAMFLSFFGLLSFCWDNGCRVSRAQSYSLTLQSLATVWVGTSHTENCVRWLDKETAFVVAEGSDLLTRLRRLVVPTMIMERNSNNGIKVLEPEVLELEV